MESEFRAKSPTPAPGYGRMLIDALRKGREEHPNLDFAVGNMPIVGGIQGAMDMADPEASNISRIGAALSFLPFGRLLGRGLRKKAAHIAEEKVFEPEEIFQKPDVVLSPAEREAARKKANDDYIKQLLAEEGFDK